MQCYAFKDPSGQPTDVCVQDDSGSFIQRWFDKLNAITKGTKHEKTLSDVVGGEVVHQVSRIIIISTALLILRPVYFYKGYQKSLAILK